MLKQTIIFTLAVAALFMTSCSGGGSESNNELCDCMEVELKIYEETKGLDFNDPKYEEVEEKYASKIAECEELNNKFRDEFSDLSEEQAEKKEKELLGDCDAFAKLKKIMEEEMKAFEESMKDFE